MPKAVAELVKPFAVAAYQEVLASILTSGAVAKKKLKDAALKSLEEHFALLQLYISGTELLEVSVLHSPEESLLQYNQSAMLKNLYNLTS